METIRVLIVDDEPLARETVRLLLDDHDGFVVVDECENGNQAVDAIRKYRPDLVFLDIQMPERDGFGVIKAVGPKQMPVVVFATAYDQYALRAFEAHALDYLLKPFDDERFEQALERAAERIRQRQVDTLSDRLINLLESHNNHIGAEATPEYLQRVMIKTRDAVFFVNTDDIDWIEAAGDYVNLHVGIKKKTHLLRETMTGMMKKLDPKQFVRIHRSSIVNISRIRELRPFFHGDYIVLLNDGTELKLSRRYWEEVERVLGGR